MLELFSHNSFISFTVRFLPPGILFLGLYIILFKKMSWVYWSGGEAFWVINLLLISNKIKTAAYSVANRKKKKIIQNTYKGEKKKLYFQQLQHLVQCHQLWQLHENILKEYWNNINTSTIVSANLGCSLFVFSFSPNILENVAKISY